MRLAGKPFILSGASAFDEAPGVLRQYRYALHPQRGPAGYTRRDPMTRKQKQLVRKPSQLVRKPSKKIADSRRVRFGSSWAPAALRK
jgi:1,4-alpha-glucan branching enzyme